MCHGFLASKDSGERLSHAVGCAFAVCLERKQRRDKECGVTMTFDMKNSTFTRTGSFRQQTMTERIGEGNANGTPSAAVAPQQQKAYNPFAIERPHATPQLLERQGSFRGFTQIGAQSPFKRQMSLRINDLPSNAERQRQFLDTTPQRTAVSPIPELSPQIDTVSQLCQELSQGLSMLTSSDTDEFIKMTNGIINEGSTNSPSKSYTSPSYTPMSVFSTNSSIPIGTAAPMQIQSEPPLVPTRFNSLVAVSNTNSTFLTTMLNSIAESSAENPTTSIEPESPPPIPAIPLSTSQAITTTSMSSTHSSPEKIVPIETVNPLPKPEQWLTEIVKSTSPGPKRAAALSTQQQNRTNTKPANSATDPFDAEWASGVVKPVHSTNPFISPPKPPVQTFQVQL